MSIKAQGIKVEIEDMSREYRRLPDDGDRNRPYLPKGGTMTTVRAKFQCISRTETVYGDWSVTLHPVTGNTGEDLHFFEATPSGSLEMTGLQADVAARFKPGRAYYLDFTPEITEAEKAAEVTA